MFRDKQETPSLKSEDRAEEPKTCVLSSSQQGATPPAAERKCFSFPADLFPPQLIYSLSKHFPDEFMVSVASFKSSSTQHDVHLVNYGPI